MASLYSRSSGWQLGHELGPGNLMRRFGVGFFLLLLGMPLLIGRAAATGPTPISGIISDTTWSVTNSPYIITGDTTVAPDSTVTIEPGVEVRFDGFYELAVRGSLLALGAKDKPILFTRHQQANWKGIYVNSRGSQRVELENVVVEYAETGIVMSMQSVNAINIVRDSVFRHNTTGISTGSSTLQEPWITRNLITKNGIGIVGGTALSYNTVTENQSHGMVGPCSVRYSVISNNGGDGIHTTFACEISYNTIEGNKGNGISWTEQYGGPFHHNNLIGSAEYDVKTASRQGGSAQDNYWGTKDPEEIRRRIYDFYDDSTLGVVTFTPFLTSSVVIPTPTPKPTQTPAATPTPVSHGPCSSTGSWDTTSNGERFYMALNQSGAAVTGTYGSNRTMEGTASGNQLTGRWSGPPTYMEPDNAGRFLFIISTDCNSFTGTWGFGSASSGGGTWSGTRLPPTAELVSQVYWEVLGRAPDPDGLIYWSNSGILREELISIFAASSEGRRVSAVRDLYVQFLGRDPLGNDNTGLRFWVDSTVTLDEIRSILLGTQERITSVRNLYLEVLARDPLQGDETGLHFWAEQPMSLNEIRLVFQASAEGQRAHAIRRIYLELLGRDPQWTDTGGLRYWVDSGLSLEEIRQVIMGTDEYRRRFGG